jgi:hypothetical protein
LTWLDWKSLESTFVFASSPLPLVRPVRILALTGCVGGPFFGRQLNRYTDLNERIGKRFPMERNIADLLTVTLMRPRVAPYTSNSWLTTSGTIVVTVGIGGQTPSLLNASQCLGEHEHFLATPLRSKSKAVVLVDANLVSGSRRIICRTRYPPRWRRQPHSSPKSTLETKPIYALECRASWPAWLGWVETLHFRLPAPPIAS